MSVLASPPRAAVRSWLAPGLVAVAAGLAVLAVLGPLVTGAVEYRVSETVRHQTMGLDAVSLCLVAPLALVAAALVRRGRVAGPALALPIGLYTAYMLLQYVLGPDYLQRAGTDERLFPLLAALFATGWGVALAAWRALATHRIPRSPRRERLAGRVLLPVLAIVAFVRYAPALADAMARTPATRATWPVRTSSGRSRCSTSASSCRRPWRHASAWCAGATGRRRRCSVSPAGSGWSGRQSRRWPSPCGRAATQAPPSALRRR
jgi:hypothetical protein